MTESVVADPAALRIAILARLADAVVLAEDPNQVAQRGAAVLRQNDHDHPQVWLLEVTGPRAGRGRVQVSASGPALDPTPEHLAEAHALAVAAVRSGQPQDLPLAVSQSGIAELHAWPIVEPGQTSPSQVLVVGCAESRGAEGDFADYLELAAVLLGAGFSGLRELAVERQRSQTLRELDAAKSTFLANVSHELRTPLALIAGPVQDALLDQDDPLSDSHRRRLQLVRSNVVRLTRMVDAMLDFSRMEAGRITPKLAELDVAALIRAIAAGFGPAIERAGLAFVVDVADLPSAGRVDPDILERIALNLLTNALKYTPRGSIRLELSDHGDSYRLAVSDTGIGIPLKDHERVFARFEQLPRRAQARTSEGAGIGLAMVRQLTELLGGTVDLVSTPGRGSTFTIQLPYRPPVSADDAGQRSITPRGVEAFLAEVDSWDAAPLPAPVDADGGRPRLLIVEDSADLGRYLAEALADEYDVEVVGDGLQALAAVRARRPDAVLSDVMMPGLDGFALVSEIRADPELRDLPVLLLSARAGLEAATIGLEHGADDYLVKPFEVADLRARLASNIRRVGELGREASWQRAIVSSLPEAVFIADEDGLVTEMNEAFTRLTGWSMADGPFRPPYPWWPDPAEDPEAFESLRAGHQAIAAGGTRMAGTYQLQRRDGRTIWADYLGSRVRDPERGRSAILKTLRDATREHYAVQRRQAAARVVADFAQADQLDVLVGMAVDSLRLLFDGDSTVQVQGAGAVQTFTASGPLAADALPAGIIAHLAGEIAPGDDTRGPVDGILLMPQSAASGTRAWVQFPTPRVVSTDEQIVADLLAQAFGIAVDRVLTIGELADRQSHLERAIESHRLIGQAVGILVERHRLTPGQAFESLRRASQDRNIRLREIAERVINTGVDPMQA